MSVPRHGYLSLGQLQDAEAAVKEAKSKGFDSALTGSSELYSLAFIKNDTQQMAQQLALVAGKPGEEDPLLEMEANTAAYFGHLARSEDFSLQAIDSAKHAKEEETAATYTARSALHNALFGRASDARKRAASALVHDAGRDTRYVAALAFAYAAGDREAEALTKSLAKDYPEDTIVQFNYLRLYVLSLRSSAGMLARRFKGLSLPSSTNWDRVSGYIPHTCGQKRTLPSVKTAQQPQSSRKLSTTGRLMRKRSAERENALQPCGRRALCR